MQTWAARTFLTLAGISLAWPHANLRGQTRLDFFEEVAAGEQQQSPADTAMTLSVSSLPDSAQLRWQARIDAGYHTPPVHPYFRDEYRVIQDLRRLLMFVNPAIIQDLASMPEMVEAARALPESRQNEIIAAAIAGSAANQFSEMVSRSLRQRRAGFLQWELEKVVLRTAYRRFQTQWYYGINMQGFVLHTPVRGFSYSYHLTNVYSYEGVNYWPVRAFGFHYGRLNRKPVYGPRLASRFGNVALNYETAQRALLTGFEFRRRARVVVRLFYANYLSLPQADYVRSEVLLSW